MKGLEDLEVVRDRVACEYCGMLCRPDPACEFCGSPIPEANVARLGAQARLVQEDLARKQLERLRREEARLESERLRLEEEAGLEAARKSELARFAEATRVAETISLPEPVPIEELTFLGEVTDPGADRVASSGKASCVRCGNPSIGGLCPACRDAFGELRDLSDALTQ